MKIYVGNFHSLNVSVNNDINENDITESKQDIPTVNCVIKRPLFFMWLILRILIYVPKEI